jgi:ribosomal protein L11 methyltransferase
VSADDRFPFVLIDVAPDDVDVMSGTLFELGAQGVEERDETTLHKSAAKGRVTLSASFASDEEAKAAIAELDPAHNPRIEEIIGDAWRDAWKEHYKPFALCDGLVVRPPWEPYDAKPGERVLELEPGRAFGTGLHETTSLVAKALAARRTELDAARVLDVGCGSGILSLVALAFGAKDAVAVDVDPEAVAVTRENAERNGLAPRVNASTTDIAAIDGDFPVVLANIEASVLLPMAPTLAQRVRKGGFLVLSGILVPQTEDVKRAYGGAGASLSHEDTRVAGEWTALVFRA